MSAVTRLLLFEMFKVFGLTLFVIASILIMTDIIKEAQLHDIPAAQIVYLLPYVVPFAVKAGFHGALVFATCVTYGRFASSNELLAVKSMGISPLKLLWPIPAFAIPLTFCCAWLHELDSDWGAVGVQSVLVGQADQIAYEALERNGVLKRMLLAAGGDAFAHDELGRDASHYLHQRAARLAGMLQRLGLKLSPSRTMRLNAVFLPQHASRIFNAPSTTTASLGTRHRPSLARLRSHSCTRLETDPWMQGWTAVGG